MVDRNSSGGLRTGAFLSRLRKELADLAASPPQGVHAWLRDSDSQQTNGVWLDVDIEGPPDTPYSSGIFRAECCLTRAFPLCPPHCRFVTPVLHPNIDSNAGRICVDILKEGPEKGRWRPHYSLGMVLCTLRQLLAEPNANDPLDAAVAADFLRSRSLFDRSAKELTELHAVARKDEDILSARLEEPEIIVPLELNELNKEENLNFQEDEKNTNRSSSIIISVKEEKELINNISSSQGSDLSKSSLLLSVVDDSIIKIELKNSEKVIENFDLQKNINKKDCCSEDDTIKIIPTLETSTTSEENKKKNGFAFRSRFSRNPVLRRL